MLRREGFWKEGKDSLLPLPVARDGAWKGKAAFIRRLDIVEDKALKRFFKGYSECRICKQRNGSKSYEYKGWTWPEGFEHYVMVHNVRPSLAFQEFITGKEVQ